MFFLTVQAVQGEEEERRRGGGAGEGQGRREEEEEEGGEGGEEEEEERAMRGREKLGLSFHIIVRLSCICLSNVPKFKGESPTVEVER